jgi:hypothetical protein
MAVNYQKMSATARRLVQENGVPSVLSRIDVLTYDPFSDVQTSATLQWPTFVVLTPLKEGKLNPDMEALAAALVGTSLSMGIISDLPAGITPSSGDMLSVSGTGTGSGVWIVRGCTPVQPNSVAILHSTLLSREAAR